MSASIDKERQVSALLSGQLAELVAAVLGRSVVDIRPFVTFVRDDVETYLRNSPQVAADYFRKHASSQGPHDSDLIYERGGQYFVAWSDHGSPRLERPFPTMIEAVAYHALIRYGMSYD